MRLVILFLFCFVGLTNATDSYAQSAKVSGDCHQPFQIYMSIVVEETKFCLLLYRS